MTRAAVLVEGRSDRIALETLARKQGRDLLAERVEVVAVGGAHALERALRQLQGKMLAGLYDVGEAGVVGQALARAGVDASRFHACDPDLEGELVRALGPERMLALLRDRGHLGAFETYRKQPAKRDWPLERQLHGWLHNWKVELAAPLVEALELTRVPRPLARVLADVAPPEG